MKNADKLITEENLLALIEAFDLFRKRFGRVKLSGRMRKIMTKELGADERASEAWEALDDVLNCIDIARIAQEEPEKVEKIVRTVAAIVGFFFPPALLIAALPGGINAKVVELTNLLNPEHLLHKMTERKVKRLKEGMQAEELPVLEEETPLIGD